MNKDKGLLCKNEDRHILEKDLPPNYKDKCNHSIVMSRNNKRTWI